MKRRLMLFSAGLLIAAVGCAKGDDDDSSSATPTPSGTPVAGTMTAEGTTITGSDGLVLLGSAGPGNSRQGGICELLQGDPASVNAVFLEPLSMQDPCSLGTPHTFNPGTYTVTLGTYVPGQQTPQQCATIDVEVNGDVSFTVPALGSCI